MTLVAQGKYLIRSKGNALPPSAALTEQFNRPLSTDPVLVRGRDQVRNRLAVPGNGNGFPMLDHPKKFRQASFGLCSLNFAHANTYQLF